jgi:hypothetical protein
MMRLAVLLLLLVSTAFSSSPLIMKHADSLSVARTRGILQLQGRVLFIHDSIEFRTQKAMWNKDAEMVTCNGGFLSRTPPVTSRRRKAFTKREQHGHGPW